MQSLLTDSSNYLNILPRAIYQMVEQYLLVTSATNKFLQYLADNRVFFTSRFWKCRDNLDDIFKMKGLAITCYQSDPAFRAETIKINSPLPYIPEDFLLTLLTFFGQNLLRMGTINFVLRQLELPYALVPVNSEDSDDDTFFYLVEIAKRF